MKIIWGLFSNNTGTIKNLVVEGGTLETDLTNDSQIVGSYCWDKQWYY